MTEQPTTVAGRHFLDVMLPRYGDLRHRAGGLTRSEFAGAILAIESEARQQDASKAHAFIGGITPDEWDTIDKAKEAAAILAALPPSAPPTQKSIEQMAAEQGVGPIEDIDALSIDLTDEEAAAFMAEMEQDQ